MLDFLLVQTLNGLVYSMLLFMMVLGLSLILGLMWVVNLAHGSFFLLGAYVAFTMWRLTDGFWLGLVVAPIAVALLGLALERLWLQRFYQRPHMDQVILTLGFSLVLFDVARFLWGVDILSLPPPAALEGVVLLGLSQFPSYRIAVIAVGLLLAFLTWFFIDRTKLGALLRAAVADREMVSGLGFNVRSVFSVMFSVGAALAGLGGVIGAPILSIYLGLDMEILNIAFVVIVVGGLGNISGAFWGSLLIGVADTYGRVLIPEFSMFLTFALMATVLLFRSWGKLEEDVR